MSIQMVTGKSHKPSRFTRLVLYPLVAVVFFGILTVVLTLANGYRFTYKDGKFVLTQTGMLIVTTRPSDASIVINGKATRYKTGFYMLATKISSLKPGDYMVEIKKKGYRTWKDVLVIKPNMVTWANYVLLFPEKLDIASVVSPSGEVIAKSENGRHMLYRSVSESFDLEMFDTGNLSVKKFWPTTAPVETWLVKPQIVSAELSPDSNMALLRVVNGARTEYVIADARDNQTKLIHLNTSLQQDFSGAWWNVAQNDEIYLQTSSGVSLVNVNATTLAAPLLKDFVAFEVDENRQILYVVRDNKSNYAVYKMDLNGNNKTLLVDSIAAAKSYKLGYSSRDILSVLNQDNGDLTAYYLGNSGKKTSTLLSGGVSSFSWYKNGEYLYYYGKDFVKRYDFTKHRETVATLAKSPVTVDWFFDESHYLISDDNGVFVMDYDGSNVVSISVGPTYNVCLDKANNNVLYSTKTAANVETFYKYSASF